MRRLPRIPLRLLACVGTLALSVSVQARPAKGHPSKRASAGKRVPAAVKLKALEATHLEAPAAATTVAAPPSRGPTRIDFDDRLVQGQTNKSGAVYLYERKELKTRSMVALRETFRSEILASVYDR